MFEVEMIFFFVLVVMEVEFLVLFIRVLFKFFRILVYGYGYVFLLGVDIYLRFFVL